MPHTPGLWKAEESSGGDLYRITGDGGQMVAVCRQHNVAILKAAPELLAGCKECLRVLKWHGLSETIGYQSIAAAIAAAEGGDTKS